jgi:hypothetical protein
MRSSSAFISLPALTIDAARIDRRCKSPMVSDVHGAPFDPSDFGSGD